MTETAQSPSPTLAPTPDRARATQLLDARRPALAAIPEAELVRPRVSWEVWCSS